MSYSPEKILQGAPNARDLGGIKTAQGKTLRFGKIIRSGHLNEITEEDAKYLEAIGLSKVVDFRTATERRQRPDAVIPGASYIECSILSEATDGITREMPKEPEELAQFYVAQAARINQLAGGEEMIAGLYKKLTSDDHAIESYGRFFDCLLDNENGCLLYHCTMGKDRVGTGTAYFLTALGVPWESVVEDYLYTKTRLNDLTLQSLDRCRKYTDDKAVLDTIYAMDTVNEGYINAVKETAGALCGGLDNFIREKLGMTEEKLERLRSLYLE